MANAVAFTILFFFCYAIAAPSYIESAQVTLSGNSNEPQVGWYDPRNNGGRFLDVCSILSSDFTLKTGSLIFSTVYNRD